MILIVDDDLAVRTSLGLLLKQAGYATRAADGPAGALAAVRAETPALVLLDMNFSRATTGDDGLALLREIKQLAPLVPVVLITGWGSIALAVAGMKAGAAEFVTKPWHNDALLQTIGTALALRDAGPPLVPHPAAAPWTSSSSWPTLWAKTSACWPCCARWARWRPPTPLCSSRAKAALARS
ncbi:response regulator [Hymenobacter coccineus]|uniref:response regulator n=1 Tax=Hymenobacter coccineus TaxID=1908235 RepID=UPI000B10E09C|nr:response regulator [Hymenobacter coccineus]